MAQENNHTFTDFDISQNVEEAPKPSSDLEKFSKNVSQVKCRIITVDEILAVINSKDKAIDKLQENIKEKDDKINNLTTQNNVLLEACTTLSQQTRESGRQNKEILIGVQQELHTVKAENAKLTDEKCKLTRKVESLRSQHDTLHEQARQLKDKNNKLVAEDKQLRTLMNEKEKHCRGLQQQQAKNDSKLNVENEQLKKELKLLKFENAKLRKEAQDTVNGEMEKICNLEKEVEELRKAFEQSEEERKNAEFAIVKIKEEHEQQIEKLSTELQSAEDRELELEMYSVLIKERCVTCETLAEELEKKLVDCEGIVDDLEKELNECETHIGVLETKLAERDALVANLDKKLTERDSLLADSEKRLAERDSLVMNLETKLAERDSLVMNLETKLTDDISHFKRLKDKVLIHEKEKTKSEKRISLLESEIIILQKKNNDMQRTTFIENEDVPYSTTSTPEPMEVAD